MLSEGSQQETENWVDEHSTKTSTLKCAGCGAAFHCQNPSLPGFVPIPMFADIEKEARRHLLRQKTDNLCRRCHLHKNYNFLVGSLNNFIQAI
jgi:hypothetical protein